MEIMQVFCFRQNFDHRGWHRQLHQRGDDIQRDCAGAAGIPAEADPGQSGSVRPQSWTQLPGGTAHHEGAGSVACGNCLSLCCLEQSS